ncbi:tetratricopeptide repeat protein [Kitasatospora sp. NPDC051914]|uniref:tetratricopeptide repeat protein n=1 Tax=Kitasatospora sp. NPDC051914 TaxID=3154945 RepID=UPI0034312781
MTVATGHRTPARGAGPAGEADAAAVLGTALEARGEHAAAEAALRRAVRIHEAEWGPHDPRLAGPLRALGAACAARGRLAEAEHLLRRVLALLAADGPEQPDRQWDQGAEEE